MIRMTNEKRVVAVGLAPRAPFSTNSALLSRSDGTVFEADKLASHLRPFVMEGFNIGDVYDEVTILS